MSMDINRIKPSYYGSGIDVIEFCLRNNLTFGVLPLIIIALLLIIVSYIISDMEE